MRKDHHVALADHCCCCSKRARATIYLSTQTLVFTHGDRTGSGPSPVIPVKKKPVHSLQLVLPELITVLVLSRLLEFLPRVWGRPLLVEESREHNMWRMMFQEHNTEEDTGEEQGRWKFSTHCPSEHGSQTLQFSLKLSYYLLTKVQAPYFLDFTRLN